ncbi:MAG: alpha,alpha-trehalose-phosphate synthase (UDP-forming) [Acidimicrobiales bacterium]
MGGLVIVSNRGPVSFRLGDDGRPVRAGSGGGLAATLRPLLAGSGATWVAASMSEADRLAAEQGLTDQDGLHVVTLAPDRELYRQAYDVVSNATLWYCHHHLFDLPRRPRLDRHWHLAWGGYRRFNRAFADAVAAEAPEGAAVLVQDYHLHLVGSMLAADRPDLRTVHFSHTPFADPSMLRVLPLEAAGELLAGMAGYGACGFHTRRWEAAYRAAYDDPDLSAAAGGATPPATFTAPLGPDVEAIEAEAASPAAREARRGLEEAVGDRRLIVRVDRIEPSKNVLRGMWALDELLEEQPSWRRRLVMLTIAYPSRQGLADYLAYRTEIERVAERVNARWRDGDWAPIVLDVADHRPRSVAALTRYDVLLVNPVRDGLNLVAKEGPLVNDRDGVLVLSREAGAWPELEGAALGIDPFDVTGTAAALGAALAMAPEERAARAADLRARVRARTAADWLADQLAAAGEAARPPAAR